MTQRPIDGLRPTDTFLHRHLGPSDPEVAAMLDAIGVPSLEALVAQTVPAAIRIRAPLALPAARTESECLGDLRDLANQNAVWRSYLGLGYYGTLVPGVILRNVLENPGWYTQYTPYQAEISQGRMEALLNFQTLVADLTGLPLANASMLDEATAAAEAMHMALELAPTGARALLVSDDVHPQTLAVLQTRAEPVGVTVTVADPATASLDGVFAIVLQDPATDGRVADHGPTAARAHAAGARVIAATDLLACCVLRPAGEWGADIAIGSAQRFGVPMGYGGPHAGFLACKDEFRRIVPGRLIGVSKDAHGRPALRLTLQTREQHIRREKATSNICTAQVLLAVMAGFYAVYHGPEGLEAIARRVHALATALATALRRLDLEVDDAFFDTLRVRGVGLERLQPELLARRLNVRTHPDGSVGVALDEAVTTRDLADLLSAFAAALGATAPELSEAPNAIPVSLARRTAYLTHPTFHRYRSEHEMLRYIKRLEGRDLSLTTSMIPLGSCTMKLNATTEMLAVTWPEFGALHPFAPGAQAHGYLTLIGQLEQWLGAITGFAGVSLQPNAGSQGEYAGLLIIRAWHRSRGQGHRNVCLIPQSAHGTNPASAAMAGLRIVVVATDARGNVDLADLEAKAFAHRDDLAALMLTYPSTHGVFEEGVRHVTEVVHANGGQVYMDGANMNAQVGLCRPGDMGADVCHLNLHKTFCIPHGGGGPGMGPVCVASHLVPFLPRHPFSPRTHPETAIGPVSAAPFGSPSILPISWAYIAMMGPDGLTQATRIAILNANYIAARLGSHYPLLYTGQQGRVAHELILDLRELKNTAGVTADDLAKRLMDYGFHAPTMSFPVAGTLMIEPTESESKAELDRFCDAMIAIREEIRAIEDGRSHRDDNPLKFAPHTIDVVTADVWPHAYSREEAVYPRPWIRERKFWPSVGRVDNAFGDRNVMCTCPPIAEYGS